MLAAFSITPLGAEESVGDLVAEAVRIVRASGLPNETNAMFTNLEGEWDEVMAVIKECTDMVGQASGRGSSRREDRLPARSAGRPHDGEGRGDRAPIGLKVVRRIGRSSFDGPLPHEPHLMALVIKPSPESDGGPACGRDNVQDDL